MWLNLDFDLKAFSRYDSKGCDRYEIIVVPSGMFLKVVYSLGTIFRETADGSEYVEVATLGLTTYSQFGTCKTQ